MQHSTANENSGRTPAGWVRGCKMSGLVTGTGERTRRPSTDNAQQQEGFGDRYERAFELQIPVSETVVVKGVT